MGILHLKKRHDLANTLFENSGRLGNLKYSGVVLRNKDCRIRKLRGN